MKTATIFQTATSDEALVKAFTDRMRNTLSGYAEYEERYLRAVQALNDSTQSFRMDSVIALHISKTASDIYYAAARGYQGNLEHFRNPLLRTFIDMNTDSYLCEHIMRAMPKRVKAEQALQAFHKTLTDEQKAIYEAIPDYFIYLETVCPKLAHVYGYLAANEHLLLTEPGYAEDRALTLQYRHMVNEFFGADIIERID